jgi:DNA-binding beta-propeller fold protein YncE
MGSNDRGMIAVDKMGAKVLFLDPVTFKIRKVIDGFQRTVHELLIVPETGLGYVPIFGDGIHGRNPNPGHTLCIFDLAREEHVGDIDLQPLIAPHTLRLGPDGHIYITCENSAVVAIIDRTTHTVIGTIDSGSTNAHRLVVSPDGKHIYTENEEDGAVSVLDLPNRKFLGTIRTPQALAGIAISGDSRTVVVVSDDEPVLFLVDTQSETVRETLPLEGVEKPAQIARYSPDWKTLAVSSLNSDTVSLISPDFREQAAIRIGSQPMDMVYRGDELFVACQGDGSVHVVDIPSRTWKASFQAGTGCESLGFY